MRLVSLQECVRQQHAIFCDEFIQANLQRIFRQIYRRVGNIDDAQELTQDVFIKALQSATALKDPAKAGHWLSRIASNAIVDFIRCRCSRETVCIEAARGIEGVDCQTPEELAAEAEKQRIIQQCLQWLSKRERMALLLRDVEGLSANEVARQMGCSQATVRSHIANARIKLRRHLKSVSCPTVISPHKTSTDAAR